MTHSRTLLAGPFAVALAAALALGAPAMAQTAPPAASTAAPAPVVVPKPATAPKAVAMAPTARASATSKVEQQITQLHTRLKITPAESQQWDSFAQTMRDNAQNLDKAYEQRSEQFGTLNAVDGLKSYQAIAQAHADGVGHPVPAFQALYAAMTPDQQKNADDVFRYDSQRQQRRVQSRAAAPKAPATPGTAAPGTATHG